MSSKGRGRWAWGLSRGLRLEGGERGETQETGTQETGTWGEAERTMHQKEREMLTRAQTQIHRDMRAGWRLTDSQPHLGERPPALFRSTSQPHP